MLPWQICSLLRGGIAERGGVRVGHRIIEINGQSVVAVPHEKIVNLLATSVGEVRISTYITLYLILNQNRQFQKSKELCPSKNIKKKIRSCFYIFVNFFSSPRERQC